MIHQTHRRLLREATRTPMSGTAGWRDRQEGARLRREAFVADMHDPLKCAIRRVRAAMEAHRAVQAEAAKVCAAENAPAQCPVTGRPGAMHPTKATALSEFMRANGWTADPMAPAVPMRTVAEIAAEMNADALAEIEAAAVALKAIEAEQGDDDLDHIPVVFAPSPIVHPPVETIAEPRRRGRPPKGLAAKLEAEGADFD